MLEMPARTVGRLVAYSGATAWQRTNDPKAEQHKKPIKIGKYTTPLLQCNKEACKIGMIFLLSSVQPCCCFLFLPTAAATVVMIVAVVQVLVEIPF